MRDRKIFVLEALSWVCSCGFLSECFLASKPRWFWEASLLRLLKVGSAAAGYIRSYGLESVIYLIFFSIKSF